MQKLDSCPICGSSKLNDILECRDYTSSGEVFKIQQCGECGLKLTNPRPSLEDLGKYYKSENYISHSNTKRGLINRLYHIARSYTLIKKLQLIMRYCKKGAIMDVGSGTGEFLDFCKKNKWSTTGVEPDSDARNFAIKNYGLNIQPEDHLDNLPESSFDIITMWHVLEHVPNTIERISQLKKLLKETGTLIVAVPNCDSLDAKKYGRFWAGYDVPRHLYHFTPKVMQSVFAKQGMKLVDIKPMVLDSFYISWLSEKYKGSSLAFLKGIITGLASNLNAIKNPKEYSSQIYVFKKEKGN